MGCDAVVSVTTYQITGGHIPEDGSFVITVIRRFSRVRSLRGRPGHLHG
jgi:hypothetical protein